MKNKLITAFIIFSFIGSVVLISRSFRVQQIPNGATNEQELQDPYGEWSSGSPSPGNSSLVTLPGFSNSSPLTTLSINFTGMSPHVGQTLYLRIVDKLNGREVARTSVPVTESFSPNFDAVIHERSCDSSQQKFKCGAIYIPIQRI